MLIFSIVYGLAVSIYYSSQKNRRPKEEHGSARWGDVYQLCRKYIDKVMERNILLTQHFLLGMDSYQHRRNLNVLVVGGSGSGKTRFYAKPNIMQGNCSFLITDPKGELLRSTGHLLQAKGYEIKIFDLINMANSFCYNPFRYIRDDKDVLKLVTYLIRNTTPKTAGNTDPFWEKSETALLQALMLYLYHIDRDLWDRVQCLMKTRTHRFLKRSNDVSLFAGVLRCADCGSKLVYTEKSRKYGPSVGSYRCSRYSNNSDIACSQHYIQENTLIAFVLKDIQLHAILADADRERISQQLVSSMNQAQKQSSKNYDRQAQVTEKRHKSIEETIKQLYEDKCSGKIPDLVFQNLLNGYITEQTELDQRLKLLREQQQEAQFTESEIEKWMQLISQHMEIKDLDRPTVLEMIESITISEARKVNGKRHQNITINYRFIGNLLGNAKEDII